MPRLDRALQLFLIAGAPILFALTSVRLVMAPWFLDFEYSRADFPSDPFGFSQEERRTYGILAVEYIRDNLDIARLSEFALPDGSPMFNARELRHLEDVQAVTRLAFNFHLLLAGLMALACLFLAWRPCQRPVLRRAALGGGVLTVGLLLALFVVVLLSWGLFFDTFHAVFFESDTWRFAYSDTLIRLFPEKFWFDAAITISITTAAGAVGLVAAAWPWRRGRR
jgi:integral membrane protein (TIGR01906 family)